MSFVLPFAGLTFIFHPIIPLLVYVSSVCLIPLLLLRSVCLCSGLKQRSLNHIREPSFAKCYPLYRSCAAMLSLFSCFFHNSAFVSINPLLSSPLFLTLTQFPSLYSFSPHYILFLSRCYSSHPVSVTLRSTLLFSLCSPSSSAVFAILAPRTSPN